MNESAGGLSRSRAINVACLLGMLAIVILRLGCSHEPFPGWSGDPFELPNPIVGITPAASLLLDAMAMGFAATAIWRCGGVGLIQGACCALAAAGIIYHAVVHRGGDLDDALLGFNWLASLGMGLALSCLCRDRFVRSLALSILIAPLPLLAIKGAHQRFVEHAQTLASFLSDKSRFIAAQGWTEGSSMALAYERRIRQAEGIGWFGLANVYAGLGVGLFVASTGLLFAASRTTAPRWSKVTLAICSALGAGILALSGAKGGYAAAGLGLACVALTTLWIARRPQHPLLTRYGGTFIAAGAVCGVLALVVIRGVIGTRIGELSVLFRWFYLEGAVSIFRDQWLTGTGPGGFREAYMLAKPALSPEDVTSPHSVLFDYASTLGLAGLGAGALWFGLLQRSAHAVFAATSAPDEHFPLSLRESVRLMALPLAAGIIGAAYFEQAVASVDSTLIRIVGLTLGVAVAAAVFSAAQAGARTTLAIGAAAAALAAHAQIELTCVSPGSVGWVICMLGVGAQGSAPLPRLGKSFASGSLALAALVLTGLTLPPTVRWDAAMRRSYASASFIGECLVRMKELARPGNTDDSPRQLVADIEAALGAPIPAGNEGFDAAFRKLRELRMVASLESLEHAAAAWQGHFPTQRALSKLHLIAASTGVMQGEAVPRHLESALRVARQSATKSNTTSAWSWLATVCLAQPGEATQQEAIDALVRAASLAPHEPAHGQRLAMLLESRSPREAARWAQDALDADDRLRLDPLRQMPAQERAALKAIATRP